MMRNAMIRMFCLLPLLWWGCEKVDVPEPVIETPKFYTSIDLGGDSLRLAAGTDDYIMDAGFKSDREILDFQGELRPSDCVASPCRSSLGIQIRHVQAYQPGNFLASETLRPGRLPFRWTYRRYRLSVLFKPVLSQNEPQVRMVWAIDGEKIDHSDGKLQLDLNVDQSYEVTLQIKNGECVSSQMQTVRLPEGGCRTVIEVSDNRMLRTRSTGRKPFTYNWMDMSRDSVFPLSAITSGNRSNIWVEVVDADGCKSRSEIAFERGVANAGFCITDFEFRTTKLINSDSTQLGSVEIRYVDDAGIIWTSNLWQQPQDGYFDIIKVDDFMPNDAGQPTRQLTIALNGVLYRRDTQEELRLKGETVFAVAVPQ